MNARNWMEGKLQMIYLNPFILQMKKLNPESRGDLPKVTRSTLEPRLQPCGYSRHGGYLADVVQFVEQYQNPGWENVGRVSRNYGACHFH